MIPHERSLVKKFANRPFALVGVECYDRLKKAKAFAKVQKITWRSFFDEKAQIAKAWQVNGFPTLYLIDEKGRLLGVAPRGAALDQRLEKLVATLEKNQKTK